MNKLAVGLFLITTTLLNVGCANSDYDTQTSDIIDMKKPSIINNTEVSSSSYVDNTKKGKSKKIEMPIRIIKKDSTQVKYLQIDEDSTMEDKIEMIIKTISKECFNDLTLRATVYGEEGDTKANIELVENEENDNNRVSWKDDYLNEYTKETTIDIIVKNVLQEEYKGPWIKKVQLYYDGELLIN